MKYYYRSNNIRHISVCQYVHDITFYRYNWHPEIEISIVLKGKIEFCVEGKVYLLDEDDLILINSNHGHASKRLLTDSLALVTRLSPEYITSVSPTFKDVEILCRSNEFDRYEDRYQKIRRYCAKMIQAAVSDDPASAFIVDGAFSLLLGTLFADFQKVPVDTKKSSQKLKNMKTIKRMIDFLEENYNTKITLESLASQVKYNSSYLSAFFKNNVGISFYEYLTRIRFRHAVHQLNNTKKSLTNIAVDCGFPDLKSFSSYYKKNFHHTPRQQRAMLSESGIPTAKEENKRNYWPVGLGLVEDKLNSYIGDQAVNNTLFREQNAIHEEKILTEKLKQICNEILTLQPLLRETPFLQVTRKR